MGKNKEQWHALTDIDTEAMRATCSQCGPVKIRKQGTRFRCAIRATEQNRNKKMRARYGITLDEVNARIGKTGGMCEACGDRPGRFVDHDHETGTVRGILCSGCNLALGHLAESLHRIHGLAKYVKRTRPKQ